MATAILATALVLLAVAASVVIVGLASVGIRHEERRYTLTRQAPDRVSLGARRLTGLHVRATLPERGFDRESTPV
jgi:hypothetical protein